MKIHYFQRYHQKENIATANTMLLLSRLYQYSSDKFYSFLKSMFFSDSFEPDVIFQIQEKSEKSIPDAVISQDSFKIVIETKVTDWFYSDQLVRHLKSFGDEKNKILITLASEPMEKCKRKEFENILKEYNGKQNSPIKHINTTFEELAKAVQEVIVDGRDYEMQDVLDDYLDFCNHDGLIPNYDSWKYLRVQLANNTFDFNIRENLYFDNVNRGFRKHNYLGLYKNKSVKAIGKIEAIIVAKVNENGQIDYDCELGELTYERKQKIRSAMQEWNLSDDRYFFVNKFYPTDFHKDSLYAPMGSRVFDLTQIFDYKKADKSTEEIAEILKTKKW